MKFIKWALMLSGAAILAAGAAFYFGVYPISVPFAFKDHDTPPAMITDTRYTSREKADGIGDLTLRSVDGRLTYKADIFSPLLEQDIRSALHPKAGPQHDRCKHVLADLKALAIYYCRVNEIRKFEMSGLKARIEAKVEFKVGPDDPKERNTDITIELRRMDKGLLPRVTSIRIDEVPGEALRVVEDEINSEIDGHKSQYLIPLPLCLSFAELDDMKLLFKPAMAPQIQVEGSTSWPSIGGLGLCMTLTALENLFNNVPPK